MSVSVELQGLTRQWDGKGGVRDVSISVEAGSFVATLGPSGCGKSTLLRLIAGLERPSAGAVRIDGQDVTHAPPAARGLSMVFQSYALFPHLTVADNIAFGMNVRGVERAERAKRLAEAVEMTGLEGFEGRKPAALSGGQRQRVALARAVVSGHPLCLMDEPLSNLDAKLRHQVRRDIKTLQRRLGLTVIYVTHDQSEAMSLASQVVLMRAGQVEQASKPADLYVRPATVFAAEFIGEPPMAILDGAALGRAGKAIGIRPEWISRVSADQADLTAVAADSEFLGGSTRIDLHHPAARGLSLMMPGDAQITPGTSIALYLPEEHRVIFNEPYSKAEEIPDSIAGCALPNANPSTAARHPTPPAS